MCKREGWPSILIQKSFEEHLKWYIVDDDDLVKESHRRLTDFIKTWHPVAAQIISEAPKTCLKCHDSSHELAVRGCALLKDGDALRLRGDYQVPLTIRAYLVDLTHSCLRKEDISYVNK